MDRKQKIAWLLLVDRQLEKDNNEHYGTTEEDYMSLNAVDLAVHFKETKKFVSYCYTRRENPELFPSSIFSY